MITAQRQQKLRTCYSYKQPTQQIGKISTMTLWYKPEVASMLMAALPIHLQRRRHHCAFELISSSASSTAANRAWQGCRDLSMHAAKHNSPAPHSCLVLLLGPDPIACSHTSVTLLLPTSNPTTHWLNPLRVHVSQLLLPPEPHQQTPILPAMSHPCSEASALVRYQ